MTRLGIVRPLPFWGSALGGTALGLGMLVPAILPLVMWMQARRKQDTHLARRAIQVCTVHACAVVPDGLWISHGVRVEPCTFRA
jgi:hypothetical protein